MSNYHRNSTVQYIQYYCGRYIHSDCFLPLLLPSTIYFKKGLLTAWRSHLLFIADVWSLEPQCFCFISFLAGHLIRSFTVAEQRLSVIVPGRVPMLAQFENILQGYISLPIFADIIQCRKALLKFPSSASKKPRLYRASK